jgi:hypothetical protein
MDDKFGGCDRGIVILGTGPGIGSSNYVNSILSKQICLPVLSSHVEFDYGVCVGLVPDVLFNSVGCSELGGLLGKLDSMFEPEPKDYIFEIKNYFSGFDDLDLSFLNTNFTDRNGNKTPDYVKFSGDGTGNLNHLYKKSNYKLF